MAGFNLIDPIKSTSDIPISSMEDAFQEIKDNIKSENKPSVFESGKYNFNLSEHDIDSFLMAIDKAVLDLAINTSESELNAIAVYFKRKYQETHADFRKWEPVHKTIYLMSKILKYRYHRLDDSLEKHDKYRLKGIEPEIPNDTVSQVQRYDALNKCKIYHPSMECGVKSNHEQGFSYKQHVTVARSEDSTGKKLPIEVQHLHTLDENGNSFTALEFQIKTPTGLINGNLGLCDNILSTLFMKECLDHTTIFVTE